MTVSTDEKLTEALERLAARATTPPDGRARVELRLRTRRNKRRALLGATAVVAVLGVSAAFLNRAEPGPDDTAVASNSEENPAPASTDAPPPLEVDAAGLPRLVLSIPELPLARADIGRTPLTPEQLSAPLPFTHFQSFRQAPDDWSIPSVYVYTIAAGASFAIGEESPAESRTIVDINGNTGYLLASGSRRALGWRLADGTAAFLVAPNMAPDQLVAIGRSMTLRPDGRGWNVAELPFGLAPVIDEPNTHPTISENHTLTFEGDTGRIELHSYAATRVDMESRIADYSEGAELTNTTVDGHPAAIARTPHDVRILWYDNANQTANYMIASGTITNDVDQIISGLRELTEQEWNDLISPPVVTPGGPPPPTSTP